MTRGRLIFPFLARLHLLDTQTSANTEIAPGVPGFDPDFREGALVDLDQDGIAERVRAELADTLVRCQVEPERVEELAMSGAGNAPVSRLDLVFHFADLEAAGLVDPEDGVGRIRIGTRVSELLTVRQERVQLVAPPTGLFAIESRPLGFGMSALRRNLLFVRFANRNEGIP